MRLLLLKSFSLDEAPYFGPNDNLFVLLCNRNLSSPFLLLLVVVISSSAAEEREGPGKRFSVPNRIVGILPFV